MDTFYHLKGSECGLLNALIRHRRKAFLVKDQLWKGDKGRRAEKEIARTEKLL